MSDTNHSNSNAPEQHPWIDELQAILEGGGAGDDLLHSSRLKFAELLAEDEWVVLDADALLRIAAQCTSIREVEFGQIEARFTVRGRERTLTSNSHRSLMARVATSLAWGTLLPIADRIFNAAAEAGLPKLTLDQLHALLSRVSRKYIDEQTLVLEQLRTAASARGLDDAGSSLEIAGRLRAAA